MQKLKDWQARKEYRALKYNFNSIFLQRLESYELGSTDSGKILEVNSNPLVKLFTIVIFSIFSLAILLAIESKVFGGSIISLLAIFYALLFKLGSSWKYERENRYIVFKSLLSSKKLGVEEVKSIQVRIRSSVYEVNIIGSNSEFRLYDPWLDNLLPLVKILVASSPDIIEVH